MAILKKTKIKIIVVIVIIISTVTILLFSQYQKVEIIYFTNSNCLLTKDTDQIIKEIKIDFGDKITTKEITVNMYPDDKPDTEEIKELRDKYQVYGVPDIIITGEKFNMSFTKDNLKKKICEEFIIQPEVCR